jgi:hypothetical protein
VKHRPEAQKVSGGGGRTFNKPAGADDWVLVLKAEPRRMGRPESFLILSPMKTLRIIFDLAACCTLVGPIPAARSGQPFLPPPGDFRTSWVGNSFSGDGGRNGFG